MSKHAEMSGGKSPKERAKENKKGREMGWPFFFPFAAAAAAYRREGLGKSFD
jgi:hypothetical protein